MRIYSASSYVDIAGETFYDVNLPQIAREYWQAPRTIQEAQFLPTSTANAGVFRQLTKFDVSGIKKTFSIIVTAAQAATLQAMDASEQTEWNVDTGTAVYLCMVSFRLSFESGKTRADIDISVLQAV